MIGSQTPITLVKTITLNQQSMNLVFTKVTKTSRNSVRTSAHWENDPMADPGDPGCFRAGTWGAGRFPWKTWKKKRVQCRKAATISYVSSVISKLSYQDILRIFFWSMILLQNLHKQMGYPSFLAAWNYVEVLIKHGLLKNHLCYWSVRRGYPSQIFLIPRG